VRRVRIPRLPRSGGGKGGRRARFAAALALALILVAAVAIASLGSGSSSPAPAGGAIPPGQITTRVTRRTLTESSTVEGTLGYGAALELYDRLAGTFTWLPSVGATIRRGGTLFRLDDQPVALMYGSVPAYRTLKEGLEGPDVAELNRNLIALGYDPYGAIADGEAFGEATAAAVDRWQEAEGLPETGKVELGRVLFAPGARRVTAVHVSLGEDPPASSGAKESPGEEPAAEKPSEEGEAPEKEAGGGEEASHEKEASKPESSKNGSGAKEPSADESAAKSSGEREGSGSNPAAAAPKNVLSTTSTRQLVQLKLEASEQGLARVGERVPVTLPGGDVVYGRITKVGRVAESGGGEGGEEGRAPGEEGGEPTISATLVLDHPVARLDEAPVSVALLRRVRRRVLAVPATALAATAGGGYAVWAIEGGRRRELAVIPGMFADGYVQIEGRGIHAGLKVTEPAE
jgi:Putative peptidoglycan binding domain